MKKKRKEKEIKLEYPSSVLGECQWATESVHWALCISPTIFINKKKSLPQFKSSSNLSLVRFAIVCFDDFACLISC